MTGPTAQNRQGYRSGPQIDDERDSPRYVPPADWEDVDCYQLRDRRSSVALELEPWRWELLVDLLSGITDRSEDGRSAADELGAIAQHLRTQLASRREQSEVRR